MLHTFEFFKFSDYLFPSIYFNFFSTRATASTHIHDKSSRSHAIFTITFIQVYFISFIIAYFRLQNNVFLLIKAKVENDIPVEIMSKLHLVDLAGR